MSILLQNDCLKVTIASPEEIPNRFRRFDRSGMITSVILNGEHEFMSTEPDNLPHPTSGGIGLSSELKLKGNDKVHPAPPAGIPLGETFPKPGVGVLTKDIPSERLVFFHPYPCEPYPVEVSYEPDNDSCVVFHTLPVLCDGYALDQTKKVTLQGNRIIVEMTVRNVGSKDVCLQEYCHNFVTLDHLPIGPSYHLELPVRSLEGRGTHAGDALTGTSEGVKFLHYSNEETMLDIFKDDLNCGLGFSWTLSHSETSASMSESISLPPERIIVWTIDHLVSPECTVEIPIAQGQRAFWSRIYTFWG